MARAYGEVFVRTLAGKGLAGVPIDLLDPVTNVRIPDTVYVDESSGLTIALPTATAVNGKVPFYLTNGKLVKARATVAGITYDDVIAVDDPTGVGFGVGVATGAALGADVLTTGLAQSKSGLLTAPLSDKGGQVHNVKAYGAVLDGVTDDTAAYQAAIDAAYAAGGGTVLHPGGIALVSTLTMKNRATLQGVGGGGQYDTTGVSIIKLKNGTNNHVLTSGASRLLSVHIADLQIDGNKANQSSGTSNGVDLTDIAVGLTYDAWLTIDRCMIRNCRNDGIYQGLYHRAVLVRDSWVLGNGGRGIYLNSSDSDVYKCAVGVNGDAGILVNSSHNRITACDAYLNLYGIRVLSGGPGTSIMGTVCNVNGGEGMLIEALSTTIGMCQLEANGSLTHNTYGNIRVSPTGGASLIGNAHHNDGGAAILPSYAVIVNSGATVSAIGDKITAGATVGGYTDTPARMNTQLLGGAYLNGLAAETTSRGVQIATNGANRWTLAPDGNAESGGSAGSNLALVRFDDANVGHTVLTAKRSDGVATFAGVVGFNGTFPSATKPVVTGSRAANAALASLLTQLASLGLLTDSSTV